MDISLGRCHFGGEDVATLTAVRAGGTGWVAVCERHRGRAEADGFEVRTRAPALDEAVPSSSPDPRPEPVRQDPDTVHDGVTGGVAAAPAERRVVVGALSLGRCHYGCAVATMSGARRSATGWIAVCADHRTRAEQDGYVVREIADVTIAPPMYDEEPGAEESAAPTATLTTLVDSLRRALETDPDEEDTGLDIFEGTFDES